MAIIFGAWTTSLGGKSLSKKKYSNSSYTQKFPTKLYAKPLLSTLKETIFHN